MTVVLAQIPTRGNSPCGVSIPAGHGLPTQKPAHGSKSIGTSGARIRGLPSTPVTRTCVPDITTAWEQVCNPPPRAARQHGMDGRKLDATRKLSPPGASANHEFPLGQRPAATTAGLASWPPFARPISPTPQASDKLKGYQISPEGE